VNAKKRPSEGFTTAELLMAMAMALMVFGTIYGFYRDQLFMLLMQDAKTSTLQDARGAMDLMVRELRNAGAWASGSQPAGCAKIVVAGPTAVRIQADIDGNGDCKNSETGEDVSYETTGATATCSGTIIRRNGNCLIPGVTLPKGSLFTYFDISGSLLEAAPPVEKIKTVRINFSTKTKNPNPKIGGDVASTLVSTVELRN